jgi:hypothetical protein
MPPLPNILKNYMGQREVDRFKVEPFRQQFKKVQICSRRLRDISNLTSSSESSDDSLDRGSFLR